MLWSLIKILVFVAIIASLALGASYLLESSGGVTLTVAGTEYSFGPLESVIALGLLVLGVWILLKLVALLMALLHFINGDDTALSRYFDRNRERKGYQALTEGIMALASGEGREALAKAKKADKYLDKPEITRLITAQAAEMAGDRKVAEGAYKELVKNDKTRFVGVRGIMKQRLAEGDTETAMKLAERAFAIRPRNEEVQDVLLRLQTEKSDWKGARETLNAKLKHGQLPRDVHKRRDAVLALSAAQEVIGDETTTIEAREAAIAANRASPDLIPAAVLAAQAYCEQGKPKYATRVLKKAWEVQPHPDLAAAFAEIAPEETAEARLKRFEVLTRLHSEHRETRLLRAELLIAAEDFPAARKALGDLVEVAPDARVLTTMAAIERGEGAEDSLVKAWLARALAAPRGPQWVCDNCHNIQAEWTPVCGNCQSFDTLTWTTPPHQEVVLPQTSGMLPLIVGSVRDEEALPEVIADADVIAPAPARHEPEGVNDPEGSRIEAVEEEIAEAEIVAPDVSQGESTDPRPGMIR